MGHGRERGGQLILMHVCRLSVLVDSLIGHCLVSHVTGQLVFDLIFGTVKGTSEQSEETSRKLNFAIKMGGD